MWGIGLGVLLSVLVGLEREYYAKAAGMRTYSLVGMGSAVFTAISKWGFQDVLYNNPTGFDGGRVAAQVVTGIGFLGAGLIFVRRDSVRGLTSAAGIWFVAAVGMAAGAGMYALSACVTALYLVVMVGIRPISARMPHARATSQQLDITYADGRGILRDIMETLSGMGAKVVDLQVLRSDEVDGRKWQTIHLEMAGPQQVLAEVQPELARLDGVSNVAGDCSAVTRESRRKKK
jgi:putative Mg2+ transporter-C (MgtC) family protein